MKGESGHGIGVSGSRFPVPGSRIFKGLSGSRIPSPESRIASRIPSPGLHSESRKKKVILGASSGYLSTLATNLISFVTVPISLGYFGTDRYGALALVMTLAGYLACAGLGVPSACLMLASRMTDRFMQLRVIARGTLVVCGSSMALMALIFLFRDSAAWGWALGRVPAEIAAEVRRAAFYAVILFLANLPLTPFLIGFVAIRKAHLERLYTTLSVNAYVVALLATVHYHGNLADLALIRGGLGMLVSAAGAIHFLLSCKGEGRSVREALSALREPIAGTEFSFGSLLADGRRFLATGIAVMIIWQTDNLVISHFAGVGAVTPYQITFRLATLAFVLFTALSPSLLPMYGTAWVERDYRWIETTGNKARRLSAFFGGLIWIGTMAFAEPVINAWAGPAAFGGMLAVFALGGYGCSLSLTTPLYPLLTSQNRIRNIPVIMWLEAGINLLLSLFLVQSLGGGGVALGTFLASILTALWLLPREIGKQMEGRVTVHHRPVALHFCRAVVPAILAVLLVNALVHGLFYRLALNLAIICTYGLVSLRGREALKAGKRETEKAGKREAGTAGNGEQ
ncbi:MAG: hypothetical protein FD174_2512 [Geobacteraceae bacterium]|nr:MAG: hypothetical protein FD174_2512 [Geobacteraceae bacterium]